MFIRVEGLEFSYDSTPVLKDIDLELEGPGFVSILGPNGVGKSTFIHCINRILKPTGGAVFIDDKDVADIPSKELAKTVGYVPYSSNDAFPLTVVDTVLMGRHPHSSWRSLRTDLDIVYDTLNMLGIGDLAMRKFNELSAGQHQKVALARGLVQEPRILLLDEPTSNLDVKHQLDVSELLRNLSIDKGILVIMICHDINIAAKFSDKIILMRDGTIFSVGTPEEVITEENLREVYDVESRIIDDEGRPHVILKRSVRPRSDEPAMTSSGTTCDVSEPASIETRRCLGHESTGKALHQIPLFNGTPYQRLHHPSSCTHALL